MKKYYILGVGFKAADMGKQHPYEVWLDLQEEKYPIVMLEGKGMGGVGGNFKPSEILQDHWKEHLAVSDTEWIIPLCEEAFKNNDVLNIEALIAKYKNLHGSMPDVKEIK